MIKFWLEKAYYTSPRSPSGFELLIHFLRGVISLCYPGSDSGSRREPKFLEDLADVVFNGALGDGELLGYLAIDQPSPDEESYLLLAWGEPFERFVGW